jgi:hypothetical protein
MEIVQEGWTVLTNFRTSRATIPLSKAFYYFFRHYIDASRKEIIY